MFVAVGLLFGVSRESMNLMELNNYPHFYKEYFYALIRPVLIICSMITIKYLRDGCLRETMKKEFIALVQKLKHN